MINNIISNMLTKIRNANLAKHRIVQIPTTNIVKNIIKILKEEGFVYYFKEKKKKINNSILVLLKYKKKNQQSIITELKIISKPGLRVYTSYKKLPKVLGGIGIAIISTSKGIMTDKNARQFRLGGEVLFYIW
uniref:30S ribosomal protein S8 n=1 Tax=Choreocolax polysiphoniae TaxID=282351 RepID=A0A0B5W2I3_9FLOR|nr:30S ribosomal protein S8 [Choreocolax polysiphoniae]AJH65859.1 30S ribosomal protein S8 [Choreocolax polysiphoniae]